MGWSDAPVVQGGWQSAPTYGEANDAEYTRQRLEALERAGNIRPAEAKALSELRASQPQNSAEVGGARAGYRGFLSSALMNARDEVTDFFGGDGEAIRSKDAAAEAAYPEDFRRGAIAGGLASMAAPGFAAGKLANGAGMVGKTLAYGGAGALSGGFNGFMDGGGASSFTGEDLSDRITAAKWPAIVGAGMGLTAPIAGAGAGALARLIANRARPIEGLSARAVRAVRQPVADSQAAMGDIRAYLDGLGPEAMLADVPGPLQSQAMGLAAMQGRGGAEISKAVNARATGAGPRIEATVDQSITGQNAAFDLRRALMQQRTHVLGPEYEAALGASRFLPMAGVDQAMDPNAVGATASALSAVNKSLGQPQDVIGPYTRVAPAPLAHNVRSELSDAIAEATRGGRGGFVAKAKPVLDALDEALNGLPGYKEARTGYANNKAMDRAIEMGEGALRGGRVGAASPAEFNAQFGKLSDAEKDAFRTGMRRDIAALMGTSKNAPAAAWGEFAKTWNEEKLRIALGAEAEPIIRRLKAEHVFSETRGRIDQGSMTARRTEATKGLEAANPARTGMATSPLTGGLNAIYRKAIDPLTLGPGRSALNAELGKFYTTGGMGAQKLVDALLKQAASGGDKAGALAELLVRRLTLGSAGAAPQMLPR